MVWFKKTQLQFHISYVNIKTLLCIFVFVVVQLANVYERVASARSMRLTLKASQHREPIDGVNSRTNK